MTEFRRVLFRSEHHVGEDLARSCPVALDELDRPTDGGGGQLLPGVEQRQEFFEEETHLLGLAVRAADRDLVAAHDDARGEGGLDELQEFVAPPEEGDHVAVARHEDLDVRGGGHAERSLAVAVTGSLIPAARPVHACRAGGGGGGGPTTTEIDADIGDTGAATSGIG